ncbi:tRNA (adenine(58)-N(1))-methyltransferase non-catalytic subunit TRM6, putative [Plasmodium relictum]|uniref:tRNA (adenine(58)-N(1))-methyltransferase non-catalytic subunit TRM6 n=1 Tax=Plasmodium relictum TaxID=85471 RepID=A0A1J1H442_PLARL|nr:tRNA (adenine(58)-N(1))-methyltransferase non-catalytic subunit TRM6, putative [Plasmodium relictum]CRG99337.1 tRNA (adenine(58)-N(1))-methyltransferase non-catalytic subunit TRM6, putative [Plasmodium relictum]
MIIKKHDFVIIDDGLRYRLHKIVDTKIKIKKKYINLLFLVNKKYGSTFTFINNKWVRSKKRNSKLDIDYYTDIQGTNKDIFDNNNSQKLTEEDIAELKKMNYENPYEIIQKLINNSSTFKEKTVISKFKYVEKKLKRHLCQFTVYECTIANLANFYYKYFPEKISYIRIDYLSNILFHLNKNFCLNKNLYNKENKMHTQKENSILFSCESNNNEEKYLYNDASFSHNILIYDDSHGLLTSVLNIYYSYSVNIFSLIYKNTCNSIIPSFGIKKNTNIVKINILNSPINSKSNDCIYMDTNYDFVFNFENNMNSKEKENIKNENHNKISSENGQLCETDKSLMKNEKENHHFLNSHNSNNLEEKHKDKDTNKNDINNSEYGNQNNPGNKSYNEEKNNCDSKDNNESSIGNDAKDENKFQIEKNMCDRIFKENVKKRKITTHNDSYNKEIINCNKNKNNENDINIKNELIKNNEIKKNLLHDICQKKAEAFVIILSSEFIDNTKTDVNLLIETLINVSLKYLKNDSKIIIHTDDLNLSNIIMQFLINTNSFINIKLNEYILREQQVIKRRTHPIIKNSKLADGFLLTALKIQN